ncbi:hypothetical protein CHLRE_16g650425v5 [Chlamydomonas reinhardtii]|uniref:Uncharacterized protein n=1 Tax=Chlamydomonas reinhardtii TaxID=3055 RepID=A0A2K3CST2_CHLRE|nr:uncharacterized protein CHLRE_16g650425v5 [Chlamydomonas reinhardtii]PNW71345.1 hypothetical protein CHLRE_16g650425v5 [Chlamydomonas reinhardtii]
MAPGTAPLSAFYETRHPSRLYYFPTATYRLIIANLQTTQRCETTERKCVRERERGSVAFGTSLVFISARLLGFFPGPGARS